MEWKDILRIAWPDYNFFPNGPSQEFGLFLMFERDVYIPMLASVLQPKLRYLGDRSSLLSVEMVSEAYMLTSLNLKEQERSSKMTKDILKIKVGDLVLLQNHKKQILGTKCMTNIRICKIINDRLYDLQDPLGHV